MENYRPKIGLALSGASGRAITHIGVLEVLRENNIPIDYITACSSGAVIAGSFACGTMDKLKDDWLRLNRKFLWTMIDVNKNGGAMFTVKKLVEWFNNYTLDKNFEDVRPALGFVCADIINGKPVTLSLGSLIKAVQASCAVPGLFEPTEWGNKLLVDGGLFSIIPTTQAREMGADIVIGVDIATTRYLYSQKFIRIRKGYNLLRKSWPIKLYAKLHDLIDIAFTKSVDFIYHNQSDLLEESGIAKPGFFAIMARTLDISIEISEREKGRIKDCDLLISPDVKHQGLADFDSAKNMLYEGRRAALEALPKIRELIKNFQPSIHGIAIPERKTLLK